MPEAPFLTYSETRAELRHVLDTAESGVPVGVQRHGQQVAIVDREHLVDTLRSSALLPRPEAVAEAGGWSILLPGTPIAADGATLDEASEEFILALREYAEDWNDHLRLAGNHAGNWALVQFVALSPDDALLAWLRGEAR
ncbi:MAG: prevent-host-death protein [Acidimicrobiia bacterium]